MPTPESLHAIATSFIIREEFPGVEFGPTDTIDHGDWRYHSVFVEGYTLGSGTLTITEKPLGEVQSVNFSQTTK